MDTPSDEPSDLLADTVLTVATDSNTAANSNTDPDSAADSDLASDSDSRADGDLLEGVRGQAARGWSLIAGGLLIWLAAVHYFGPAKFQPPDPATTPGPELIIDLNSATYGQLRALPDVGEVLAKRILAHRQLNGPFGSVDELVEVKGFGPIRIARLRPMLVIR